MKPSGEAATFLCSLHSIYAVWNSKNMQYILFVTQKKWSIKLEGVRIHVFAIIWRIYHRSFCGFPVSSTTCRIRCVFLCGGGGVKGWAYGQMILSCLQALSLMKHIEHSEMELEIQRGCVILHISQYIFTEFKFRKKWSPFLNREHLYFLSEEMLGSIWLISRERSVAQVWIGFYGAWSPFQNLDPKAKLMAKTSHFSKFSDFRFDAKHGI